MFSRYEVNNNVDVNQMVCFFFFLHSQRKQGKLSAQVKEPSQFRKMFKSGLTGWHKKEYMSTI